MVKIEYNVFMYLKNLKKNKVKVIVISNIKESGVQWLKPHAALPEDLNLISSTHVQLFMTHNSSSRRYDNHFWAPQAPTHLAHTQTSKNTHK